jgi:CRISPR-associated protein Cas10/Cmr2, subtype III-B
MQQQYMLMFSLGPVQTFIAQARKTRDLWLGSFLMAKLMESALTLLPDDSLVFPAQKTVDGYVPDIPNKYVAIFSDEEQALHAAQMSEQEILRQWNRICQQVWDRILGKYKYSDEVTRDIWQRQTKFSSVFELYWVIVPDSPTYPDYKDWLAATEALFDARKRLRDFQSQEEPGIKSTISGEREALHSRQQIPREFWLRVAGSLSPDDIDPDGNECLDAIDTIKRFAMNVRAIVPDREGVFPSTSSLATASFVEQLLTRPLPDDALNRWRNVTEQELVERKKEASLGINYLKRIAERNELVAQTSLVAQASLSNQLSLSEQKKHVEQESRSWLLQRDGDLYFPALFTEQRLKKDYAIVSDVQARDLANKGKKALRQLLEATRAQPITSPTPYYGVIQMDGDNMGILLSEVKGREEHQSISKTLSTFARQDARTIVEERYSARLVYAGGDDVLALAPLTRDLATPTTAADSTSSGQLETILALADELQRRYCEQLRSVLPAENASERERRKNVSASAGLVVAHHYTSLSYVIRAAREAEQSAKKRYGKNALAVTIIRRSGEQTQVGCKWRYDGLEAEGQPLTLFTRFYHLFKKDILSPKCVYTLLEEAPILVGLREAEAQISEIKRVLLRQIDLYAYIPQLVGTPEERRSAARQTLQQEARRLVSLAAHMDVATNAATEKAGTQQEPRAVELHASTPRAGLVETLGWLLVMAFFARKDQE